MSDHRSIDWCSKARSHILFEQKEDCITIWYVIDGKPVDRDSPPLRLLGAIITPFKILA
jgi:hypothetical protein